MKTDADPQRSLIISSAGTCLSWRWPDTTKMKWKLSIYLVEKYALLQYHNGNDSPKEGKGPTVSVRKNNCGACTHVSHWYKLRLFMRHRLENWYKTTREDGAVPSTTLQKLQQAKEKEMCPLCFKGIFQKLKKPRGYHTGRGFSVTSSVQMSIDGRLWASSPTKYDGTSDARDN